MTSATEDQLTPDFEIDHPDEYAQFFLTSQSEIAFYLNLLVKRGSLLTVHIDDGKQLFLTSIAAIDGQQRSIAIDGAPSEGINADLIKAQQITLAANLDKVKIQFRLRALKEQIVSGQKLLTADFPDAVLRLQRREFFRLEAPQNQPILCRVAIENQDGSTKTYEWNVADISGGGISLIAPTNLADDCKPNTLFKNSRLEIPGEGVLMVNLRVRKNVEFSAESGHHHLRVGCEFVELPGSRLAMIERYITRIERERKARDSGLAD